MTSYTVQQGMFSVFTEQRLNRDGDIHSSEFSAQTVTSSPFTGVNTDRSTSHCDRDGKGRYSNIEEGLESSLSLEARNRINRILAEAQQLSDVEKLLLYLKLPSGSVSDDPLRQTPPSCLHASNRTEQAQAFTWIRSHLEEDAEICLPKQEVYDDYRAYCDNHHLKALCTADFGKVMKCVFPNVKPRRLGQRGQSRYCYGGLRKKLDITAPVLPELEIQTKKVESETKEDDEIYAASCQLVCEWARKLIGQNFQNLRELAEHLVANICVNSKSVAAFTVIAAMQEAGIQNPKVQALFTSGSSGDKHRETQLQLQRKLQERELLKEQKRKLQQQREENEQQMRSSSTSECKTPVRPSSTVERKTPVRAASSTVACKTPKLPSPPPSPLPLQSPSKYHLTKMQARTEGYVQPSVKQAIELVMVGEQRASLPSAQQTKKSVQDVSDKVSNIRVSDSVDTSQEQCMIIDSESEGHRDSVSDFMEMEMEEGVLEVKRQMAEENDRTCPASSASEAENQCSVLQSEIILVEKKEQQGESQQGAVVQNTFSGGAEQLQKPSLKMLLERKDYNENSLNQSLGFSLTASSGGGSSSSGLFVNQTNIPSRSAFVPFSQVQPRKDALNLSSSQSSVSSIPVIIPSSVKQTTSQSMTSVYTFETVPSSQATISVLPIPNKTMSVDQVKLSPSSVGDGVITLLPVAQVGSSSIASEVQVVGKSSTTQLSFLNPLSSTASDGRPTGIVSQATTTVPVLPNPVSNSVTVDTNLSQTLQNSPSAARPGKSRFAPIRPKPGASVVKDQKGNNSDNPVNDKRSVATILKEKRAREAMFLQGKLVVPNMSAVSGIQFQQGVPINSQTAVGKIPGIPADLLNIPVQGNATKEVVIILNNAPTGNAALPAVLNQAPPNPLPAGLISSSRSIGEIKKEPLQGALLQGSEQKKSKETHSHAVDMDTVDAKTPEDYSENSDFLSETPVKMLKLDTTSPFRPDSACSIGRETPIKIIRVTDQAVSRPESACSIGRETPSGGRKRKSCDIPQRRNFKRLNSTGEIEDGDYAADPEDVMSNSTVSEDYEEFRNGRRTQSCTFEMDRDLPKEKTARVKLDSLQSPDISSLEREALIEAFPSTSIPPLKSSLSQRSSVGVGVKSWRNSQQKLLKQQHVLNERMKHFLHKDSRETASDSSVFMEFDSAEMENLPESSTSTPKKALTGSKPDGTNETISPGKGISKERLDAIEGNDLPSDVADFITEVMEKRRSLNQSAMSEPDMSAVSHRRQITFSDMGDQRHVSFSEAAEQEVSNIAIHATNPLTTPPRTTSSSSLQGNTPTSMTDSGLPNLNFDMDPELLYNKANKESSSRSSFTPQSSPQSIKPASDNLFTVPKLPPVNSRLNVSRMTSIESQSMFTSQQQRCSSLPSFTARSPVQVPKGLSYQRASSMSPQVPPSPTAERNELSSVTKLTSPLGRIEVRENHPISVHVHNSLNKGREEGLFHRPNSLPIRSNEGRVDEGRMSSTPYLASIQHSLQKPGEPMDVSGPLVASSSPVSRNQLSRESSTERAPAVQSNTPFSDLGYHSIGGSPIMNSTPVSCLQESGLASTGVTSNVSSMGGNVHPSPIPHPGSTEIQLQEILLSPEGALTKTGPHNLRSVNSSTFIPIQGSNNDIRYVTPIRPTVTVANSAVSYSEDSGLDSNHQSQAGNTFVLSPKSQDPPSYENAMKFLQQTPQTVASSRNLTTEDYVFQNSGPLPTSATGGNGGEIQSSPQKGPDRASLLADMGLTGGATDSSGSLPDNLPFSFKLAQLSRQTVDQEPTKKPTANSAILAALQGTSHAKRHALLADLKENTSGLVTSSPNSRGHPRAVIPVNIPSQNASFDLSPSQGAETSATGEALSSKQNAFIFEEDIGSTQRQIDSHGNLMFSSDSALDSSKLKGELYPNVLKTVPLYDSSQRSYPSNVHINIPNALSKSIVLSTQTGSVAHTEMQDAGFMGNSPSMDLGELLFKDSVGLGHSPRSRDRDQELNEEELLKTWEDLQAIEGVSTDLCLDAGPESMNTEREDLNMHVGNFHSFDG